MLSGDKSLLGWLKILQRWLLRHVKLGALGKRCLLSLHGVRNRWVLVNRCERLLGRLEVGRWGVRETLLWRWDNGVLDWDLELRGWRRLGYVEGLRDTRSWMRRQYRPWRLTRSRVRARWV